MGVRTNQRLPKALAGLPAVALMAVAAMTTLSAQTVMPPRLVVRALTNGDIAAYKLPSTTQVSGGLETVALGEPLYLEVQIDMSIPAGQIAGAIWTLTTKPLLSAATLAASPLGSSVPIAEPSDRLAYQVAGRQLLRPDVPGIYVVTATVTAGSSGSMTMAQTFIAGTYMGVAACTKCHNGGLAQVIVPTWSQTEHASMFTNGVNGVDGTGYGAGCIACHTVGYDANSTVKDGGFSAMASQMGWTFPSVLQAGNFAAMPAGLQNVSNIQCENCHGPGSEHAATGDPVAISLPSNSGACSQCHDEPSHHIKSAAWANSMHAVTTRDPVGNATCAGCHSGDGFVNRMNGATITDTSYHAINCYTCHEPHGQTAPANDAHLIRNMASATLSDGTKVTTAGEGVLCMQCHQSRVNASTYVDTTAGSAHFGPHEGPQADMLMGTNGYTYGEKIPSSAHQYIVQNTCVACHMQTVAATDPAFLNAGDHTFKTTYAPAGKPAEDLVAACQGCHGPEVTAFDFPLFDYDGDGVIDGVQTEVQHLLDKLSTMLPPDNTVKTALTIDSTWTKPQLEAAYNWLFVTNDGSHGVHNTAYAVGLLKGSIANLQSHK